MAFRFALLLPFLTLVSQAASSTSCCLEPINNSLLPPTQWTRLVPTSSTRQERAANGLEGVVVLLCSTSTRLEITCLVCPPPPPPTALDSLNEPTHFCCGFIKPSIRNKRQTHCYTCCLSPYGDNMSHEQLPKTNLIPRILLGASKCHHQVM